MNISEGQEHVDPKHAAEELLGDVKWVSDTKGFCRCPGEHRHTVASGDRECVIYLDGAPTIFCFHQSCGDEVRTANHQLRNSSRVGFPSAKASKGEIKQHVAAEKIRLRLEQRARCALKLILEQFSWKVESLVEESPNQPQHGLADQWKDIVSLFKSEDVLWIGEKTDSGAETKRDHFHTTNEWLTRAQVAGTLTCPTTFKLNSFSRSNDNVSHRRFLVVESDLLSKDQICAVFRWLKEEVGLNLRAVVDTAGKSLHGWFDYPKAAVIDELEIVLPQLGCDKGMFRASQPCRMPGAKRGEKYQTLIYLNRDVPGGVVRLPSTKLPLPQIFFADQAQCYWRETAEGTWQRINEKNFEVELKAQGFSFEPEVGELLSKGEEVKRSIQLEQNVSFAGRIAGYSSGPVKMLGRRMLITEGPRIVEPEAGNFPLIRHLVEGLLKDQTPYFYGWIKRAYSSLRSKHFAPGQALAICGAKNSGKSLLQNLITEMLGGRMAKPYQFMTGGTSFNSGMCASEHLMIEDEAASTRMENRKALGAIIKSITVNDTQACYTKFSEEIALKPFWRLSITMNEEPEDLMVLPPLYEGVQDKVMLLKAATVVMPMPTESPEERTAFWKALVAEVPAFLAALLEWEPPDELRDQRFGIKTFHHPALLEKLGELQPEFRLLQLIDSKIDFFECLSTEWSGTALKLESKLTDPLWWLCHQAKNLFAYQNTCGTLLGRLASNAPGRVQKEKETNGHTVWKIRKAEAN